MDKTDQTLDRIYSKMRSDMTMKEMWDMIEATITEFDLDRHDAAVVRGEFN